MIENRTKVSPAGFIPIDWKIRTLRRVATVQYGISDPLEKHLRDGVLIIGLPNVSKDGVFNPEPRYYVPPEKFSEKVKLCSGDILFNWRSGSRHHLGKTLYYDFDGDHTHVGFLLRIRQLGDGIVPRYIDAYLKFIKQRGYFLKAKIQVNSTFNKGELLELPVVLPPLPEQRKIAAILSTWDEAIAKTEQLITSLQARKKGLMQRLLTGEVRFPGFGGEWEEYKSGTGTWIGKIMKSRNTNRPSHKKTKVGWIPEGWNCFKLGEICTINYGKSPRPILDANGEIPVIGSGDGIRYGNDFNVPGNTVVIGRKGSIKKPRFYDGPVWVIDTAFYTSSYRGIFPKWLYYYLFYHGLERYDESTGIPSLNRNTLSNIKLTVPPIHEQQKIAAILSTWDETIAKTEQLITAFQQQKKGLMQRLLTGELRVMV